MAVALSLAAADAPGRIDRLETWLTAVHEHQPGELDAHVTAVAAWPVPQIAALWIDANALIKFVRCPRCPDVLVVDLRTKRLSPTVKGTQLHHLRQLADRVRDGAFGSVDELLKRGAFLHTDIPMLVPLDDLPPAPPERPPPPGASRFGAIVHGAPQRIVMKASTEPGGTSSTCACADGTST